MKLSSRELWTALHGMIFGAGFLLVFAGVFCELWDLRSDWLTDEGTRHGARRLIAGAWTMAILAWLAVIVGTYAIYPWYRAKPPKGMTGAALVAYPKALLLSNPQTADWHEFAMEWKEHIGWFAPMLATAVAFVVTRYRRQLSQDPRVRRAVLFLFATAFCCAAVAGLIGAMINKFAPTR